MPRRCDDVKPQLATAEEGYLTNWIAPLKEALWQHQVLYPQQ